MLCHGCNMNLRRGGKKVIICSCSFLRLQMKRTFCAAGWQRGTVAFSVFLLLRMNREESNVHMHFMDHVGHLCSLSYLIWRDVNLSCCTAVSPVTWSVVSGLVVAEIMWSRAAAALTDAFFPPCYCVCLILLVIPPPPAKWQIWEQRVRYYS